MSKIIYSSLVKLPKPVFSIQDALDLIYQYVDKPKQLLDIPSELVLVDTVHINIIRYFKDIQQYKDWIFSDDRNNADCILMQNGFYLYTKQAHYES